MRSIVFFISLWVVTFFSLIAVMPVSGQEQALTVETVRKQLSKLDARVTQAEGRVAATTEEILEIDADIEARVERILKYLTSPPRSFDTRNTSDSKDTTCITTTVIMKNARGGDTSAGLTRTLSIRERMSSKAFRRACGTSNSKMAASSEARPDYRRDLVDIQRLKTRLDRERVDLQALRKKQAAAQRWIG
jgi:uncharacterized protein YlxW (UPF0749 family)